MKPKPAFKTRNSPKYKDNPNYVWYGNRWTTLENQARVKRASLEQNRDPIRYTKKYLSGRRLALRRERERVINQLEVLHGTQ